MLATVERIYLLEVYLVLISATEASEDSGGVTYLHTYLCHRYRSDHLTRPLAAQVGIGINSYFILFFLSRFFLFLIQYESGRRKKQLVIN